MEFVVIVLASMGTNDKGDKAGDHIKERRHIRNIIGVSLVKRSVNIKGSGRALCCRLMCGVNCRNRSGRDRHSGWQERREGRRREERRMGCLLARRRVSRGREAAWPSR